MGAGAGSDEEESGVLGSDDILAAFRARREERKAVAEGRAPSVPASVPEPEEAPVAGSTAAAEPVSAPTSVPPPVVPPVPTPAPEPTPTPPDTPVFATQPTPAPARAPELEPAPEPTASESPTEPPEPFGPIPGTETAIAPRGGNLTALQPGLGLSERLLADTTVTVRGNFMARAVGAVVVVFGLLVLVLERRGARMSDAAASPVVLWIGSGLVFLGLAVFIGFLLYPPARTLGVKLAASQQDEWKRVQDEAKILHLVLLLGLGMLVGGLLFAFLVYAFFPSGQVVAGAGFGIVLAVLGGGLSLAAWSRRGAVHRLYVQTLILSRLEQTGLGVSTGPARDERLGPVLQALDKLLGHLPESTVRAFLQSDQAQAYLELIDEAQRDG